MLTCSNNALIGTAWIFINEITTERGSLQQEHEKFSINEKCGIEMLRESWCSKGKSPGGFPIPLCFACSDFSMDIIIPSCLASLGSAKMQKCCPLSLKCTFCFLIKLILQSNLG